jgi:hypothetical protein
MDIVKRTAQRLKLHKVGGTVIHHCALLKKILPGKPRLVHGYCVSPGEVCEHYWVQTEEGLDLDIGMALATLYSPDLADMKTFLTEEFPVELKDVEVLRQPDNQRLFELYETDPVTFWKESPKEIRAFPTR